ncbi:MAG: GNAT family N-acetyltransferase [Pseudomonadota bacterium]
MTLPSAQTLHDVIEATWPAAATQFAGGFVVRQGAGGGSRVSSATALTTDSTATRIDAAEAMKSRGQPPLFMIRDGDTALDEALAGDGYQVKDPSVLYASPIGPLAAVAPPPISTFQVWPPLAAQNDIWAEGGIGPSRRAVMDRATCSKTSILGRINDRPAATAYVGFAHDCAMIHALEVAPTDRRQGLAALVTRAAAIWGQREGALWLTLVTTQGNIAANALYTSLGMTVVGHYHYRIKSDA